MLVKMNFHGVKEIPSPYLCKKVMERIFKNETFKYMVDKIMYVTEPCANDNGRYEDLLCVVFIHTKSTHKSSMPFSAKRLEQKILEIVEKTSAPIQVGGKETNEEVWVSTVEQKETPADFNMTVPDMLLEVIVTKARNVMTKVVDGEIIHGVLNLQGIKPRTVRPQKYEWVSLSEK